MKTLNIYSILEKDNDFRITDVDALNKEQAKRQFSEVFPEYPEHSIAIRLITRNNGASIDPELFEEMEEEQKAFQAKQEAEQSLLKFEQAIERARKGWLAAFSREGMLQKVKAAKTLLEEYTVMNPIASEMMGV